MASIATPMPGADTSAPSHIIESGRDLLAAVPSDIFSDVSNTEDTSSLENEEDAETFETPEEIPSDDADPIEDDQDADSTTEDLPDAADPADTKKTTTEELPEGVKKGKDRNGKDGYFLEENRYKTFHGNHKMVQELSGIIGEPATVEALSLRNQAFEAQERLFGDLNSGDATAQRGVMDYIFGEMSRAKDAGEVGADPTVSFAKSFYDAAREKAPDAYANLRLSAARDLVDEMFKDAAASGDKALFVSAQHIARKLAGFGADASDMAAVRAAAERMGIPVYTWDEAGGLKKGADPLASLRAENAALKSKLNGGTGNDQAAQFGAWTKTTNEAITSGVREDAVKPALVSVAKSWEKFPTEYNELVVDRLHRKVAEVLNSDQNFKNKVSNLKAQAKRAVSEQVRAGISSQIKAAYVNRAKLAVDVVKGEVLKFAANSLKGRSDETHARRSEAQTRTAPKGSSATVPRSLIPNDLPKFKDNMFDRDTAMKQLAALIR